MLSHRLEVSSMGLFVFGAIKQQIVMNHLVNHDVPESLFIEIEIVGEEDPHVLIILSFFPVILESSQKTKRVENAKLGSRQVAVEILAATPEHLGHRIVIGYHIFRISFDAAKLVT